MPPGSSNPNPISYFKKNVIFHTRFQTRPLKSIPVFRPGLKAEIMSSLLRLERKQKNSSNPFRIRIFSFFLTHSELKRWIRLYTRYFQTPYSLGHSSQEIFFVFLKWMSKKVRLANIDQRGRALAALLWFKWWNKGIISLVYHTY